MHRNNNMGIMGSNGVIVCTFRISILPPKPLTMGTSSSRHLRQGVLL